jgi:hypothetical protein
MSTAATGTSANLAIVNILGTFQGILLKKTPPHSNYVSDAYILYLFIISGNVPFCLFIQIKRVIVEISAFAPAVRAPERVAYIVALEHEKPELCNALVSERLLYAFQKPFAYAAPAVLCIDGGVVYVTLAAIVTAEYCAYYIISLYRDETAVRIALKEFFNPFARILKAVKAMPAVFYHRAKTPS